VCVCVCVCVCHSTVANFTKQVEKCYVVFDRLRII